MTNYSALHYSEKARKAAVGTIDEYPAGSAKYWADQAQAIVNIPDASESQKGLARLATTLEASAGTNDTTIMTPKKVKQVVDALQVQDATESVKGVAMLATQADALAGADDSKIMTPAKVAVVAQELHDDIDDVAQYAKDLKERVDEIELFKFPNATIIGTPTINNGQISGFTADSYLQFPFELDLTNRRLRTEFEFTTSSNVTTQQNVLDSQFGIALAIANGKGLMAVSSNGTSWNIGQSVGTMTIQPNTTYRARLTWDGLQYKTFLSTNGIDYVQDMTLVSNQRPYPRTIFIGGCSGSVIGHDPHPFLGSINLNRAFLYLNDVLIWQGMDDAGLASRADVSLDNLDSIGQAKFDAKQDALVSGTNIKTLNGSSILGSGDLEIGGYFPDILEHKWSDHLVNDMAWLRADTFSWQSGQVYSTAYQHLVADLPDATAGSETIAGITIEYATATDGHKIVLSSQETAVEQIYQATGVAWYYIVDTTNQRFKLPRTKYGFVGLRDSVGGFVPESLPNAKGHFYAIDQIGSYSGIVSRAGTTTSGGYGGSGTYDYRKDVIDLSKGSSTYQDNAPVQQRATQMYLYFYVGEYSRSAVEQTAGVTTEVLSNKADADLSNINASASARETIVGWGMPDYTAGISVSNNTVISGFTAPKKGILMLGGGFYYPKINGIDIANGSYYIPDGIRFGQSVSIQLDKDDVFSCTNYFTESTTTNIFYPYKGVN